MFADTASHQAVLSERLRQLLHGFVRVNEPRPVQFEVMNGLQSSCLRKARLSELTIGAATTSDLILLDDGVADQAVNLIFENSLFGNLVRVCNVDAQVLVDGGSVAPGQMTKHCNLPLTVTVDGIDINVGCQPGVRKHKKNRFERVLFGATTAALVFAIALAGLLIFESTQGIMLRTLVSDQPDAGASVAQVDFVNQFRERLAEAGLADSIDLWQMQEGGLQASGELPAALLQDWARAQIWFEGLPNAPMLVSSVSVASGAMTLPAITMLRLSEPRALYLASGQILDVMDTMSNGWTVQQILQDTVVFSRGTETIEFSLQGNE